MTEDRNKGCAECTDWGNGNCAFGCFHLRPKPHLPAEHPDETARAIERTREYIRARYGDGPIPAFYTEGAVLFTDDDR